MLLIVITSNCSIAKALIGFILPSLGYLYCSLIYVYIYIYISLQKLRGYFNQEPITQREGALNLCMYADSTCCQIALAQHSLYGKCYVSAIIYLALV